MADVPDHQPPGREPARRPDDGPESPGRRHCAGRLLTPDEIAWLRRKSRDLDAFYPHLTYTP